MITTTLSDDELLGIAKVIGEERTNEILQALNVGGRWRELYYKLQAFEEQKREAAEMMELLESNILPIPRV